jgi:glutamate/tyrosine decarboxylase-like PLP-dependent enzyme
MSDIHIDDFFKDAATTLNLLFANFPRPSAIYVEDISGPIVTDEFGVPGVRTAACFATLLWLGEEGYLRYADTIRQEAIDQAVLTARCFTILGAASGEAPAEAAQDLPESVRAERNSRINLLRAALKSGSSVRVRHAMTIIMTAMDH